MTIELWVFVLVLANIASYFVGRLVQWVKDVNRRGVGPYQDRRRR